MLVRKPDDEGFGLVEVIIAFFLLAIIAIAILPGLWNGIRYSSQQSSTATATRQLNAIIEGLRGQSSPGVCSDVRSYVSAFPAVTDGRGNPVVVAVSQCAAATSTVSLTLTATVSSTQLAAVSAVLYSPTATASP